MIYYYNQPAGSNINLISFVFRVSGHEASRLQERSTQRKLPEVLFRVLRRVIEAELSQSGGGSGKLGGVAIGGGGVGAGAGTAVMSNNPMRPRC